MSLRRGTFFLALAIPFFATCSSSAPPPDSPGPRRGARMAAGAADELSMLSPPASWWHDPQIAEPLHLSGDQFQRLDALEPQEAEVSRLERDSMMALRELRTSLDTPNATATGIVAAGTHFREMRNSLLEHQITLLAAQREILTADQWTLLQRNLAEQRRPERWENGRGMGRGRGPGGRGGRRPGW